MVKKICVIFLVAFVSLIDINAQSTSEHKTGTASYYHDKFEGRKTATGDIFDNDLYTCASNHYPLGTYLKITNIANKKAIFVKVNDRMGHPGRVVDLTSRAAKDLNFHNKGLAKVKIEVIPNHEGKKQILAQLDNKIDNNSGNSTNEL